MYGQSLNPTASQTPFGLSAVMPFCVFSVSEMLNSVCEPLFSKRTYTRSLIKFASRTANDQRDEADMRRLNSTKMDIISIQYLCN